ncbi:MAG TPA: alpha/beta fold hydrolase [Candidatus Aminicenantes bacterium]|nr:alpha/beta fold hydrolase [Candidatus Aminicenantes bacterium]
MNSNKKWTVVRMLLALIVVFIAAGLILAAPKHVTIDAGIAVGEEIMLTSQGTDLAASFLAPAAAAGSGAPVPGVVMITGSGAYSYRTSWKPGEFPIWKNIAEAFLAKGYAVLLLEKKGVNRSGGHWETQSFRDRADDAIAGVRYLKGRAGIDPSRVGVCGHSQGGWIVQLAAAAAPGEIAFAVSLAGPNISVKQQIVDDVSNEWRCRGLAEAKVARKARWQRTKLGLYGAASRVVKIGPLGRIINYDPEAEKVAARIRCPLLAVYGEYDSLVMPASNIALLEKGLAAGGHDAYTIVLVPRASHGFVRKDGICPQEFKDVPAMAPELFAAIAAWDPFQ